MLVVDASALVPALADDGADGRAARRRLRGETLAAPELVDLEVASVLRRLVHARRLTLDRAADALSDLSALPLARAGHTSLIPRCWELRESVTPYDAAYVALAESLGCTLLTGDARLSQSTGPACPIELVPAADGVGDGGD